MEIKRDFVVRPQGDFVGGSSIRRRFEPFIKHATAGLDSEIALGGVDLVALGNPTKITVTIVTKERVE